jgi:hypothetical protein
MNYANVNPNDHIVKRFKQQMLEKLKLQQKQKMRKQFEEHQ